MKPKLYYAEWIDSGCSSRWTVLNNFTTAVASVKTIGWLVSKSKEHVCLAGSYIEESTHTEEQFTCFITIPKVALKKFYPIKIKRK